MGRNALKQRDNWQTDSGFAAEDSENNLYDVLTKEFAGTTFRCLRTADSTSKHLSMSVLKHFALM